MTPVRPSPPGSTTRSSSQPAPETTPVPTEPGNESPRPLPWNLGAEFSYLLDGQAGSPFRVGLLAQYRPNPYFAAGLHLDTNFSEEFTLTGRAEGRLPITDAFSLHGALELGVRALFGQEQWVESLDQRAPVSGGLLAMGIELGGRIRIGDLGIGIFSRILYSPPTGVSVTGPMEDYSSPASLGASGGGHEITIGIRLELDPQDGASLVDGNEATEEESPPAPQSQIRETREALQSLRSHIDRAIEQTAEPEEESETPESGETPNPRREVLQALQQDLTSLYGSADQLEEEISDAHQAYQDWNRGTEALNDLHIRMDEIYYHQLVPNPPEPNLAQINGLARDWRRALEQNPALRSRLRQREEANSLADHIDNQLSSFTDQLAMIRRYFHAHPSGEITRQSFDNAIADLTTARQTLGELRQEDNLIDFHPGGEQIANWQQTLDSMATRLRQLNGDVPQELRQELQERYERLRTSFQEEVSNLELEANNRERYEITRPHFYGFRDALSNAAQGNFRQRRQRAEEARGHLQEIHRIYLDAPPQFHQRYRRSLVNLFNYLQRFVEGAPPEPTAQWREAQRAAVSVLHQLNSEYQAPEIPEPRRPRRRRTRRTDARATPRRTPPRPQQRERGRGSETAEIPPGPDVTEPPTESDE